MLYPQQNLIRRSHKLDGLWSFRTDPDQVGEAQGWQRGISGSRLIAVPGSWNEQIPDLANYMGVGWYQRAIDIPAEWAGQPIRLRIGSVNNKVRVWVNGRLAGGRLDPYLPCDLDVGSLLNPGEENTLIFKIDACLDPWMIPPASLVENEGRVGFMNSTPAVPYDFFPYGGIHRSVYLYTTGIPRIETVSACTQLLTQDRAEVLIAVGMAEPFHGTLQCRVNDQVLTIESKGETALSAMLVIQSPRVWSVGKGELYKLDVLAEDRAGNRDCYRQNFGVRTIKVDGDKFLLNGEPVFFRGFGKHEDFHIIGKGHLDALLVRDFEVLKWVNANSFRTSHYPYDEAWLNYADSEGILVIDETPFVGLNTRMYTEEILGRAKGIIRDLIRRDNHHPSVVMWSLANEPNTDIGDPTPVRFFKELVEFARAQDPSRPITYVAHREPEYNEALKYYDVVCVNKYYGWYIGPGLIEETLPELGKCLQRFRDAFGKPVILAEFGADAIEGFHRMPSELFTEEYQSEIIEKQYQIARSFPWCIGAHVWAFADFKTAQSITRLVFNRKGVFTRERQPKQAAHMLRQLWGQEAVAELSWTKPESGLQVLPTSG
jgi:beta-glucuronidase